mgnify:CR=1 FL=1
MIKPLNTIKKTLRTKELPRLMAVAGAEVTANQVGCAHGQPEGPQHRAVHGEDHYCGQVGHQVGDLGCGTCLQKSVAEHGDKQDHEEGTGTRPKKPVVRADAEADHSRPAIMPGARRAFVSRPCPAAADARCKDPRQSAPPARSG